MRCHCDFILFAEIGDHLGSMRASVVRMNDQVLPSHTNRALYQSNNGVKIGCPTHPLASHVGVGAEASAHARRKTRPF
jgi:hypothetical protein